jgi:hypothetical protein
VVVVAADQAIGAVPSEFKGRFYRLRALAGTQRLNLKLIHLALRPQEDFIRGIPPEEGFAHVGSLLLALNHYPKDAELHLGRGIGALWMAHTAKPTWKLQSLAAEEVNRFNQGKGPTAAEPAFTGTNLFCICHRRRPHVLPCLLRKGISDLLA